MKHLMILILLFSTAKVFAGEGNSLVRFVCQGYSVSDGELFNKVVIVEQTSLKEVDSSEIVDGSVMIDSKGEYYTGDTEARMRIYNGVSLVSDEKTKEEIINELLKKQASRDIEGTLMDFTGIGGRLTSTFGFDSITPYEFKGFILDLKDLTYGRIITNNGAARMHEDGRYRCEEPVLMPVSE